MQENREFFGRNRDRNYHNRDFRPVVRSATGSHSGSAVVMCAGTSTSRTAMFCLRKPQRKISQVAGPSELFILDATDPEFKALTASWIRCFRRGLAPRRRAWCPLVLLR